MKRINRFVFSLASLTLVLAGCQRNGSDNPSSSASSKPSVTSASSKPSTDTTSGSASTSSSETSAKPGSTSSSSTSTPSTSSNSTPSVSSPSSPSTPSTPSVSVNPNAVTSIKIMHKTYDLQLGDKAKIDVMVLPLTATAEFDFVSSDTDVCTVDAEGNIKAVGKGNAIVTATTKDGKFSDTCKVNVVGSIADSVKLVLPETAIRRNSSEYMLELSTKNKFSYKIGPDDGVYKNATFSVKGTYSDTTDSATVSNDGEVTCLKVGSFILTVSVTSFGKTLSDQVQIYVASKVNYNKQLISNRVDGSFTLEKANVVSGSFSVRKKSSATSDTTKSVAFDVFSDDSTMSTFTDTDNTKASDNQKKYVTYDGIYDGSYYHLRRNVDDNSYADADKKVIKSDSVDGEIDLDTAKGYSSVANYYDTYGFGEILKEDVLKDNNFFNQSDMKWKSFDVTLSDTDVSILAKGVYEKSGFWGQSTQNYYDISFTMKLDSGMVMSFDAVSKVYDKNGYDFTNDTLKTNAKEAQLYEYHFSQKKGTRSLPTEEQKLIHPKECYFTSYTLKSGTTNSYDADKAKTDFIYNGTVNLYVMDKMPATATTLVDPIVIETCTDETVIKANSGLQAKALKPGTATLTTSSSKGVKATIDLSVRYAETTEVEIRKGYSIFNDATLKVGNKVTLKAEPNEGADPDYEMSLDEKYQEFATLTKTDKGYDLVGVKKGGIVIKASSHGVTAEKGLWIVDSDIQESEVQAALSGNDFIFQDYSDSTVQYQISFAKDALTGMVYRIKSGAKSSCGSFSYTLNGFKIVAADLEGITKFDTFELCKDGVQLKASFKCSYGTIYGAYSNCFVRTVK